MKLILILMMITKLSTADLEQGRDLLTPSLESLLSRVLPEVSSCLVLVYPSASAQDTYLDLIKTQHGLRVSLDSPHLHQALVASYRMKCNGYVTESASSWEMLTALGEARLEAMERHTPRILILPSKNLSSGTGCDVMSHHEAIYIPDILLVAPQDISKLEDLNSTFSLYTNKFVGRIQEGIGNCLLLGTWPHPYNIDFYPDKTRDLHGKEVVVFTLDFPPYALLQPSFDGTEARLVYEFCRRHNCSVSVITDQDLWGEIFDNGTGTGLSGSVYMDRAEVGYGAVYAWEEEHRHIDYSFPYLRTSVTVLVPKPAQLPEWRIPFLPFTLTLWALQLLSVLGAALVLALVNKASSQLSLGIGGEFSTLGGIALRALAMALLQPPPDRLPSASPLRRFITIFELLFFFFATIYSGALSAVLTVPVFYPPIDSPLALYEAGIPWAANHEAWIYSIKGATEPHLQGLVARFESHDSDELLRLAKKGGYGFSIEIMAAGHVTQMKHLPGEIVLGLHVMKRELYYTPLVFVFRKGSPYTEGLNNLLGRCLDSGLMLLWETDVTLRYFSSRLQTAFKLSESSRVEVKEPKRLRVVHVQGAFYMLSLGLALAALVFIGEMVNF